jgi:hypothetical protein
MLAKGVIYRNESLYFAPRCHFDWSLFYEILSMENGAQYQREQLRVLSLAAGTQHIGILGFLEINFFGRIFAIP